MIALRPEAEVQLDALISHYEALGRVEASINLLNALERAKSRISERPDAGLPAPRPYPAPVISGVFYAMADIPNRIFLIGADDLCRWRVAVDYVDRPLERSGNVMFQPDILINRHIGLGVDLNHDVRP